MFLCRAARRSAAALDQAFKSPGSFPLKVKASSLRNVTLALRKGHRSFCVSAGGVDPTVAHLRKQPDPVQTCDPSSGFIITDLTHLDRVANVAVNLSRSLQSEGGYSDIFRLPLIHANGRHMSRGEPAGNVLFTGKWTVSNPRCFTRNMQQSRAASTAAKKEQTADSNNKEVNEAIQLKCLSNTSELIRAHSSVFNWWWKRSLGVCPRWQLEWTQNHEICKKLPACLPAWPSSVSAIM